MDGRGTVTRDGGRVPSPSQQQEKSVRLAPRKQTGLRGHWWHGARHWPKTAAVKGWGLVWVDEEGGYGGERPPRNFESRFGATLVCTDQV